MAMSLLLVQRNRASSVPQIPFGKNSTKPMKMSPMNRGQDSVTTLKRSSSTRYVAAPTKGPKNVPAPPSNVMITTWPDVVQYSDSTGTTASRSASRPPASPQNSAENTNDSSLIVRTS